MSKKKEMVGLIFGRLTVLSEVETPYQRCYWSCLCTCGNKVAVRGNHLRANKISSCGCLQKEWIESNKVIHGQGRKKKQTSEYKIWGAMKYRCTSPVCHAYKNYGGRGITVCDRWLQSFENFYSDMGPRPEGKSLDRINNNGNYEPGNCRWATPKEQVNNRRPRKECASYGQ